MYIIAFVSQQFSFKSALRLKCLSFNPLSSTIKQTEGHTVQRKLKNFFPTTPLNKDEHIKICLLQKWKHCVYTVVSSIADMSDQTLCVNINKINS